MEHKRIIEIIAVVTLAVILIGEVLVYTSGSDDFNVDASTSDDGISYSISVNGSQPYYVSVFDNGTQPSMEIVYIYHDERYVSNHQTETGPIGSIPAEPPYYIDQLVKNLKMRGVTAIILDADELKETLEKDVLGSVRNSLVSVSGVFPDTMYTGNSDDLIFEWLNKGGRLYWVGGLIGAFYSTVTELVPVDGYQQLFFGSECLNTGETDFASADVQENELRYMLSLKNNRVKYAVDVGKLPAGVGYLALGYSEDDYSSIVFTEYGEGNICIMGGDLSRSQWSDLSQVIASGICHQTTVIDHAEGSVRYDTVTGTVDIGDADNVVVYIYLGGYYPVYGRTFHFV